MKKQLLVLVIALGAITAFGQKTEEKVSKQEKKVEQQVAELKSELGLTEKQVGEVSKLLNEKYEALKPIKKEIKALEAKSDKIKADYKVKMKSVLTEEQLAKIKKKKK